MTNIWFVNIDNLNRPVFKDRLGNYYGSLDKLFPHEESEESVLEVVEPNDITYFGSSFGCEPIGTRIKTPNIVRSKQGAMKQKHADGARR
ncbi:MAG: hypothetical protein KAS32_31010 [Candidatus Peribacteraceae bacterium]|nr:hypothetical protein [Candidatus Peribacteraceae bacterium]